MGFPLELLLYAFDTAAVGTEPTLNDTVASSVEYISDYVRDIGAVSIKVSPDLTLDFLTNFFFKFFLFFHLIISLINMADDFWQITFFFFFWQ